MSPRLATATSPSYSRRWRRRRADFPLMVGCAVAHCVCFAAASGLGVGAGSSRGWIAGAMVAPSFMALSASTPPRCGGSTRPPGKRQQGEADAGRHLDNPRAELQKPQTDGGELGRGERVRFWDGVSEGEHQPVGGGVQDQPHLVGERAAAAGAIGGKLSLV